MAIATRPIEKGEEINNCYGLYRMCVCVYIQDAWFAGPQVGRMKRTERLTELERKYYFQCSCPACDQYVLHTNAHLFICCINAVLVGVLHVKITPKFVGQMLVLSIESWSWMHTCVQSVEVL